MRRFFYATSHSDSSAKSPYPKLGELSLGANLALPDSITHHWCRVLRANVGDKGVLFDGFGGEYTVRLQTISKKQATATLLAYDESDRSAPITSKIALVMSRGERMDYAIQKSCELGVSVIQLLSSHHGEVNLKPAQVDKKRAHWQQVAIAACEQCGLNRPPLILAPMPIDTWLSQRAEPDSKSAHRIEHVQYALDPIVAEIATQPYYKLGMPADMRLVLSVPDDEGITPTVLLDTLSKPKPIIELLIGPEGGLSADERLNAIQVGFEPWQIGNRVLRTETAPVVALATLHALLS